MMTNVQRAGYALTAAAFLVLVCVGVEASDRDEGKAAETLPHMDSEGSASLPFAVTGTMIAPPTKLAIISMTGSAGQAGAQMLASEGAVVAAYRVVSIHSDRVVFERDGHTFLVRVGAEARDALTSPPGTTSGRKGSAPLRVVAPPANIEEIRQQTGAFIERLKANPEFQNGLDERMRRVRERGGASQ